MSQAFDPDIPRPAATLLLLRDAPFEVLMVTRHHQIDFAGGAMVFPGGAAQPGDRDPAWRDHVGGWDDLDEAQRPLRIAAIREAWEEAGILVAEGLEGPAHCEPEPRAAVDAGKVAFLEVVKGLDARLSLDALTVFSHWITPQIGAKRYDTFFYGYGDKFRREWMQTMIGEPSRRLPEVDFAMGGGDYKGDTGRGRMVGDVPFNVFAEAISAARINLNITRRSHATVPLSSTCRPFELAACGAAVVSNPHAGIEQWFTPGEEIMIVNDADEAVAAYEQLLGDPAQAIAMGERARQRVLDEHTYAQRARQLLGYLNLDRVQV